MEQNQRGEEKVAGKMFVRALLDFMLQEVVAWLMSSLDWTVIWKLLVLMVFLRLRAQLLGCLSVVILVIFLLLI